MNCIHFREISVKSSKKFTGRNYKLKQSSVEYCKTKRKAITPANHSRRKQFNAKNAGKWVRADYDCFCVSLVGKLALLTLPAN